MVLRASSSRPQMTNTLQRTGFVRGGEAGCPYYQPELGVPFRADQGNAVIVPARQARLVESFDHVSQLGGGKLVAYVPWECLVKLPEIMSACCDRVQKPGVQH